MSDLAEKKAAVTAKTKIASLSDFTAEEGIKLKSGTKIKRNDHTFIYSEYLGLWAWAKE